MEKAKRTYNETKIRNSQNKSKMSWEIINSYSHCNDKKDIQICVNNMPVSPQDTADNFNMYFSASVNDLCSTKTIRNGSGPQNPNTSKQTKKSTINL